MIRFYIGSILFYLKPFISNIAHRLLPFAFYSILCHIVIDVKLECFFKSFEYVIYRFSCVFLIVFVYFTCPPSALFALNISTILKRLKTYVYLCAFSVIIFLCTKVDDLVPFYFCVIFSIYCFSFFFIICFPRSKFSVFNYFLLPPYFLFP